MLRESPKRPEILAQWARLPLPQDVSVPSEATRTRVVAAIARTVLASALGRSNRRRMFIRRWFALAAAAALVLAGALLLRPRASNEGVAARMGAQFGVSHANGHGGQIVASSPSSSGLALGVDSHVATDRSSSSRLQLVSGVEIVVGPQTVLALADSKDTGPSREELALDLGVIHVRVPKLPKGHFFAVRTPNAVVSVHGTAFSVQVSRSGPSETTRTRVVVTEGVVSVRHGDREVLLDAGTEWASSAGASAAGAESPSAGDSKAVAESSDHGRPPRAAQQAKESAPPTDAGTSPPTSPTTSIAGKQSLTELANQNALFLDAMNARDRGDRTLSVTLLDEFCSRYPASPLAQDAYVARFRILSQTADRAAAARAASAYLAQYPSGFAAREAAARLFAPDSGP
jgi:FecR-like protein